MTQHVVDVNAPDQQYWLTISQERAANRFLPIRELLDKHQRNMRQSYKKVAVFIYELCATHKFSAVEFPQGWIGMQLNYTRQTISTAIKYLQSIGLIKVIVSPDARKPNQYIFCAPNWLKLLIEKIPRLKNLFSLSNKFTRSDKDLIKYKNKINNKDIIIDLDNLNTRARIQQTGEVADMTSETVQKSLTEIRSSLGLKARENKPAPISREVLPDVPDLATCKDSVLLGLAAMRLEQNGQRELAKQYQARKHELERSANAQRTPVANDQQASATEYNPWADPPLTAAQVKKPKEKREYVKDVKLPAGMAGRILRATWALLSRTKETDPAELAAQVTFAIMQDVQKPEVAYESNPFNYAFNRAIALIKKGEWQRPFGYVDQSSQLARTYEDRHKAMKRHEINRQRSQSPTMGVRNIMRNMGLPYND